MYKQASFSDKCPKLQLGVDHYLVESLVDGSGCVRPEADQLFGQLACRTALPKPLHREMRRALASFVAERYCNELNEQSEKWLTQPIECSDFSASRTPSSPPSGCVNEEEEKEVEQASSPNVEEGFHSLIKNMSGPQLSAIVRAESEMSDEMLQLVRARDFELERLKKACEKQFALVASSAAPSSSDENLPSAHVGGGGGALDKEHLSLSALNEKLRQTSASYRAQIEGLRCRQRTSYREMINRLLVDDEPALKTQNSLNAAMRKSASCDDTLRVHAAHRVQSPVAATAAVGLSDSFTIYVGAQLKSMHNVRIATCERLTDACRPTSNASSRLNMLMSLYGRELSGVVLMVGTDPLFHIKTKSTFAKLCEQSTELHFDSLENQLTAIDAVVRNMNSTRRTIDEMADCSYNIHRKGSTPVVVTAEQSGRIESQGELRPGDVYVTRHSTLSSTQVVFHLVGDQALVADDISSRHPCILGLRNIVRLAARAAVQTISLPLLLVEQLTNDPVSTTPTTQWCLGRAELVFKCIKGFLMEVCSIGATASNGGSSAGFVTANGVNSSSAHYNVNFLVPTQISREQFHQLVDMFTAIYHLVPSVQT